MICHLLVADLPALAAPSGTHRGYAASRKGRLLGVAFGACGACACGACEHGRSGSRAQDGRGEDVGEGQVREALGRAREVVRRLRYLELYDNVLYFDRWHACPPASFDFESEASGYFERLRASELTGPNARAAVDALRCLSDADFPSDIDRGVARYLIRRFDEASHLPADLAEERMRMNADAQRAWEACCREDDFAAFAPTLERAFDLDRRIAEAIDSTSPSTRCSLTSETPATRWSSSTRTLARSSSRFPGFSRSRARRGPTWMAAPGRRPSASAPPPRPTRSAPRPARCSTGRCALPTSRTPGGPRTRSTWA